MAERVPAAVALREQDRKTIEEQVREFLQRGGKIEKISVYRSEAKPVGRTWNSAYSNSFDSLG